MTGLYTLFFWCLGFLVSCVADYGVDKYDIGAGFGHFGIAVEDVSSPATFPLKDAPS